MKRLQSSFDDSAGHATNYMVDLPAGRTGVITGNIFVQGKDKENYSALIAVAAEGVELSSDGLSITGNDPSLAPGANPTTFVADFSGAQIGIDGNRLSTEIARLERR